MKDSILTLRDIVNIKDARLTRPRGGKDTVTVIGDMIDHTGAKVPVKFEAQVENGQGIHFIQQILGQSTFERLEMVVQVRGKHE